MKTSRLEKMCLVCGNSFRKKSFESRRYWKMKKYCSRRCSLVKTSIRLQKNCYSIPRGSIPWNKGVRYDRSMKSRLDISGLKIGRGYMKGKHFPQMQGKENPRWSRKETLCAYCRKVLILQPCQVRSRNFCNRTCWALGTRGIGSPVYLGDLATKPLRERIMAMDEYGAWRNSCLKRDHWRCRMCHFRNKGSVRRMMHVDHIRPYADIIRQYGIKTLEDARSCGELWDPKNGRTLCEDCHRRTDTYGRKNRSLAGSSPKTRPDNHDLWPPRSHQRK